MKQNDEKKVDRFVELTDEQLDPVAGGIGIVQWKNETAHHIVNCSNTGKLSEQNDKGISSSHGGIIGRDKDALDG